MSILVSEHVPERDAALQFNEQHGEVCPAGWRPAQQGMKANAQGVADYLAENAKRR
ncbi:MAG: hypothetical protein LBJ37_04735 [Paucimonas sp.]|jgi:peroxiredoxin (alkyl hydroperoxide reductase subunit C)|nr:hypothetical protein [Paucimonas sp.]